VTRNDGDRRRDLTRAETLRTGADGGWLLPWLAIFRTGYRAAIDH
jgi:hypothetical protein